MVEAGGVGITARVVNRQLIENPALTKRSNRSKRAELERNWNTLFLRLTYSQSTVERSFLLLHCCAGSRLVHFQTAFAQSSERGTFISKASLYPLSLSPESAVARPELRTAWRSRRSNLATIYELPFVASQTSRSGKTEASPAVTDDRARGQLSDQDRSNQQRFSQNPPCRAWASIHARRQPLVFISDLLNGSIAENHHPSRTLTAVLSPRSTRSTARRGLVQHQPQSDSVPASVNSGPGGQSA
jgi:hypothetical protein